MKNKSPALTIFLFALCAVVTIVANNLNFEYCVNRECPLFLTVICTIAVMTWNIWMFVQLINLVKRIFKL